jgi:hypothetical protein
MIVRDEMFTALFWRSAAERCVKTVAQTLLAAVAVGGTDVMSVGWKQAGLTALVAGVLSLATSTASSQVGDSTSPSVLTGGK